MTFQFLPDARLEYVEAIRFYEEARLGLGTRFAEAVNAVIRSACETPQRWPRVYGSVRRGLVKRFPYVVYYRERLNKIDIIAIAHKSRAAGYWTYRVE